ncbi:MAG: hypothetical protein ABH844_06745 [Candidatus Omnitrophota bacterium]
MDEQKDKMKEKNNAGLVMFLVITLSALVALAESGYDSAGQRDPFVPLVGIDFERDQTIEECGITAENINIQGIVTNPDGKRGALINGEIINEKAIIGGDVFVEEIQDNAVVLIIQKKKHIFKLYEE